MKTVILAGGKGRRLLPYTTNFPKPLMPIVDKPILEIVIARLRDHGLKDIIIAAGHLGELIQAFFQGGTKFGVKITYSKEDQPLGTAGPLNLVRDELKETFLVMNGDLLTDIDFTKLVEYHNTEKATATIALFKRTVNIDFGVVTIADDNTFYRWDEKPDVEYLVSTGIYIFDPGIFHVMPKNGFLNLPDLIELLHDKNQKVSTYLHNGYWLDIGRAEDYAKACEDYQENFLC